MVIPNFLVNAILSACTIFLVAIKSLRTMCTADWNTISIWRTSPCGSSRSSSAPSSSSASSTCTCSTCSAPQLLIEPPCQPFYPPFSPVWLSCFTPFMRLPIKRSSMIHNTSLWLLALYQMHLTVLQTVPVLVLLKMTVRGTMVRSEVCNSWCFCLES